MAYTDFIAAVDLGTSHMVGMVGKKDASGKLSILAYETDSSDNCIRRGCIYNVKETAGKINRLVRLLENKVETSITKIYIGVGGQSLRTMEHKVTRVLGNGAVTEEMLREMNDECRKFLPDQLTVLDVASPTYYLDGEPEMEPLGMTGARIEAHYKLVVGRPLLRRSIENMCEHLRADVAGIVVTPLALADLILTDQEKMSGSALIDFGAGVTSVTLFLGGKLLGCYVIPLGSQLITRDLMTLGIPEREGERLKRSYGNALWEKDADPQPIPVDWADGRHSGELKYSDINRVVEARCRELIENVYARLVDAGVVNEPGYSLVIAGNGSVLKNLLEALAARCKMNVRYAAVRRDCIADGEMIANNHVYMTAAALLLKGTVNCALVQPEIKQPEKPKREVVKEPVTVVEEDPQPEWKDPEPPVQQQPQPEPKPKPKQPEKKGGGFFGSLFDSVSKRLDEAMKDVE